MSSNYCNSCGQYFQPGSGNAYTCPACGSNNIIERSDPNANAFWKSRGFIIAVSIFVLMLLLLLLLPKYSRRYEVRIDSIPSMCKYGIVVTRGGSVQDSSRSEYSLDSGKTWQRQNEIRGDSLRVYSILIRPDSTIKRVKEIKYLFTNPYTFAPLCKLEDPCDCKNIYIDKVTCELRNNKKFIIIRASRRTMKCNIEYSINGPDGSFQKADSFPVSYPAKPLEIYIRTEKCGLIPYNRNPYTGHITIQTEKPQPQAATVQGKWFNYAEVDIKPYLINFETDTRNELVGKIKGKISGIATRESYHIILMIGSAGSVIVEVTGPNPEVIREIKLIINELGDWQAGTKDDASVNTKWDIYIEL